MSELNLGAWESTNPWAWKLTNPWTQNPTKPWVSSKLRTWVSTNHLPGNLHTGKLCPQLPLSSLLLFSEQRQALSCVFLIISCVRFVVWSDFLIFFGSWLPAFLSALKQAFLVLVLLPSQGLSCILKPSFHLQSFHNRLTFWLTDHSVSHPPLVIQ